MSRNSRKKRQALVSPMLMLKLGIWSYPFQLVDRVIDFERGEDGFVVAIKNVTFNEPQFTGHFPDNPVMPGVLIAEALGQTSHYLEQLDFFCVRHEALSGAPLTDETAMVAALNCEEGMELASRLTREVSGFLASQDLRFKHFVVPGDTLELHSRRMSRDERGFIHYEVKAYIDNTVVCEGRIVNFRRPREAIMALLGAARD